MESPVQPFDPVRTNISGWKLKVSCKNFNKGPDSQDRVKWELLQVINKMIHTG
jgi:hypothetical protein